MIDRRTFGKWALGGLGVMAFYSGRLPVALAATAPAEAPKLVPSGVMPLVKSDTEWKTLLTSDQYRILREEGTERAYTSPLTNEHRAGIFACIACDLPLFSSDKKFDSGTGWPSFFDHLPGHLESKRDASLGMVRTEYHCARCGGHHGHLFTDGPKPTGLRYCNNGVALKFMPTAA